MLEFETRKKDRAPIDFTVDGRAMSFTPTKTASMVLPVMDPSTSDTAYLKAFFDWLGQGMSEEDSGWLVERLEDPKDDFDIEDLQRLAQSLMAEMNGGRPTMSSSGSTKRPKRTGQPSRAGVRPKGSTKKR